jgi:fibro-slime domain-containing protein
MKEKIKRISSSTWALVLALMMVVSSFSVLAATTNVNKTGGSECFTANQTLYVDIGDTWENLFKDNTSVPYVTFSYSKENNDLSKPISRVPINESDKVNGSIYKITVPDNKYCRAIRFERTKYGDPSTIWNSVLTTSAARFSDDQNLFTISDYNTDKGWSIYNGGSTTTDLYLCGYINNSDVGHGDNRYKLTQSDDKYSGTFEFDSTSNTQFVTISNGSMAYVAKRDNAASGTEADSKSPTSESPNPNFKWMVDTSTSKTITFTWDDTNKTLSWVNGSVEPTETTPTVTTPVSGDGYYLYNDNGGKSFKTSESLGEFSNNVLSLDLVGKKTYYLYVVRDNKESDSYFNNVKKFDDSHSVTLYDYGANNFSGEIEFTPETSGKYKFTWEPDKGATNGTLKYELESTPVAKSVNLTANPENVVVGGSTTLTANVTELNSGASNVKYTFTEVKEDGTTVGTPQELSTDTATFTDLTKGKHYYKVTVSADGYTSVTATVEVNVNQTYNVTAKYKITYDGVTYSAEKADTNIVTVDGAESSTTSFGTVVAKDTITIGSSTYVFAGWESANGSFTDATKSSTTFRPSADADVYALYKKQYTVSASTTGDNGTINVEKDTYLAGDTVTININPNSGYQLKSLMRTTGISGEKTDVKAGVSNNKYVVDNISSNETFVAEFEKNPLDYSKYRVVGHFDDNKSWLFNDGCKFDTNGKATFTIAQPTAVDGNGQFRIAWGDGSTTIQYGCGQNDLKKVVDGEIYTPVKGNGKPYYVPYEGTYVVEIVNIDSNGVPKFKVTKDDTISKYQLYISTGKSQVGKLLGNFTKAKDGTTYQYIITVDAGTHYFYIKDSTSTDSTLQYSDGRDNCKLGDSYLMNKRNNVENIQYKLSAGSYKVTYGDFNTNGEGKFKIVSLSKPLAESVTLSPSATAVKIGNKVTLTAEINKKYVEDSDASYTYTFYDGENKIVGERKTKELTASCETTSDTKGVVSYKVVVSTDATYADPEYPTVNLTYTDVPSDTIQVDYREKILYIAKVEDGKLGKLYQLTKDSFKPADGAQSVTIAVFSDETISDDTVCNLTVSESKNKYTTITSSTIDTDDVAGIPTYTINCNEGASSPTIYIVDNNIYAVATFDMGATNTFENKNTVDYYFAEPTDGTDISNPTTGDGLRIYYWNNSVADKNGYADVTTKVDQYGKDSGSNTITVNMDDLYNSGVEGSKTFNVYKVSLPVWATSFKFVSSDTTEIKTFSTFVPKTGGDASIGLNPNRIYLLYQSGSSYYSRGVVLDSSFWTETSRENNDVPTKNFKANAVNYNTQYDAGGNVTNTFNTYLNALYDTAYANPLFFGYVDPKTTEVAGNQNFRIQDNLAMRHDNNHAYYASVQGLAGNTLSSTSKNENGCGYLMTADGSGNMPLFDYDKLKNNTDVASSVNEGLNFPFNESTFNGITTYSYDSFTDKNRVIDGDFKVDTYSNATVGNDKGVGFFPFDNSDSTKNANKYGFGTEFDIDFYMSETGKLTAADGTQKDITFNFSGDDDVWVYVDGVLVLDLGGAHKVSSGSINFSDMKVIYKAAVDSSDNINNRTADPKTDDKYATDEKYVTTVDLAKIFKANGAEFNNKNSSKKHTLQMFYMERGSFDSNCSVSFNLPQNTGLLVRNDVNFDSVNPGLKDATMGIANKDYFSYMIENKYASDAEFDKLKGKYVTLPNKTTSDIINNNGNFTFDSSNPLYPIVTTDNIIRRVVNGTTYYLAVKNDSGKGCESYWSTHLKDAYTGLPSINFSLPDDFAKLENSTDENNSTAVSGQTDTNGGFNLLFNQSAKFNSKIPSNTMVKVVQNETLYEVNAGDSNTAMSVATSDDKEKVTRRNVSNFYSTSYKITDDKSQKVITEAKGNKDSNVFSNDTSAGTDGFYFADYSENHSDSSAMTVNFTNTVSTSDIKIIKKVTSDNSDNKVDPKSGDRFTFAVKLSNIFGDKDDTMLNEYENLTYKVYDSSTGKLEGTRTYGKSGVSITANEYAVITGIPVGTHYEVTEKQRTGYQFDNVTGEFVATTLNSTKAGTQTNGIKDTDFISCNDSVDSTISTEAETVTGNMPIANDANNAGKTVQLTYTNKEAGFTISFKYYDREVKTGTVAHINTKPTVVNYVFSVAELAEYQNQDGTYDYARMITKAVTAGRIDPDNVIDSYKCFTSQADAETGIQNEYSYRDFVKSSSTYKTYGTAYPKGNFKNHTDCYGRLQGSDGATVSDGEDWVSYYNGKTKYETETDAKMAGKTVTSITVWFFNNLKSYKPTFHYATAINELSPIGDTSKFVGTKTNIINPVFYNVRLGVANGVDSIDEEGSYLKEYGVTGFTGTYSGTAMSIQNGKDELKFLYWSYDENGKSIASNSYKYGYRITNNIKLYAIYGNAKDNTNPGLTVSMNSPDYHKDSNGIDRVRLNTVMNVYNCPDDDPNIKNVAVIYILDPNNYIQSYINENNTTALSNIRTNVYNLIKANGSKAQFSGVTIQIDGKNDNKALGLTYTASKDLLTNKNRVQFTTDFKQSALASQKIIYTFSAMNYYKESATEESKTDWIVSDNCIKYIFDATGKVTGDSTQVNCLQ